MGHRSSSFSPAEGRGRERGGGRARESGNRRILDHHPPLPTLLSFLSLTSLSFLTHLDFPSQQAEPCLEKSGSDQGNSGPQADEEWPPHPVQQCAPGTQPRVAAPAQDLSGRSNFLLSLHQTEQLSKTDTLHPAGVRQAGKGEYTLHPLSRLPQKCTGSNVLFHTFTAQANTPDTQVVQDQASVRHFQSRHFKRCRQTGSLHTLNGRLRTPVLPGALSTQGDDTVGDCRPTISQRHWEHPAHHGEEEPPNNIKGPHVSDVSVLTNALMVIGPRGLHLASGSHGVIVGFQLESSTCPHEEGAHGDASPCGWQVWPCPAPRVSSGRTVAG